MGMVSTLVCRLASLLAVLLASRIVIAGENVWTTNGPAGNVTALATDPEGVALFAATSFEGRSVAYRSLDHGSTWSAVGEAPAPLDVQAIAFDASHRDTIYAAAATPLGAFPSGSLYGSFDAGSSWRLLAGLDGFLTRAIRTSSTDPSAVYTAGTTCQCVSIPCFGHTTCTPTVLRSHDSGETWSSSNEGFSGFQLTSIEVDPHDPARLLSGGDAGAFASTDGGAHWTSANAGREACPWVTSLASGGAPNVFYAAAAQYGGETLDCGGLFRTDDGGRSWRPTSLGNAFVTSVAIDPSRQDVVYAGVSKPAPLYPDGGVFRTADGGRTWERVGVGLPDSGVLQLVVEPSGNVIHAGTSVGVYDITLVPGARPPVIPPRNRATRTLPPRN
jgi:photosystem II stability/assembly factor-like uncharacterized protein